MTAAMAAAMATNMAAAMLRREEAPPDSKNPIYYIACAPKRFCAAVRTSSSI
jgi:hypothetical protein